MCERDEGEKTTTTTTTTAISQPTAKKKKKSFAFQKALSISAVPLLIGAPFCFHGVESDALHSNAPSSARKKGRRRLAGRERR